jgi:glyoxylase-like metal-dependent hydrolase (beta-lactamase superfamily II)
MAKSNIILVGDVEIMALSDGILEFDLCNFFPTIPEAEWQPHAEKLTAEHKVRFNLGSYLIRSSGRTILVDTGLGPRPADTPDVPWGELLRDFSANGVRPDQVDMVVMTHLHRDHVGGAHARPHAGARQHPRHLAGPARAGALPQRQPVERRPVHGQPRAEVRVDGQSTMRRPQVAT